LIYVRGFLY